MTVRNIKKNLAGAEDLLHGIGVETQSRGGAFYDMHKLDTYVPTYDVTEMQRSSLTFMRLYGTDTAYTDYRRNPTGTIGIPSELGGVWEPIRSSELPICGNFTYGAYVFSSDCVVGYNNSFMQWKGALPKVVPAGSTPASTGGIDSGAWVVAVGFIPTNIFFANSVNDMLIGKPVGGNAGDVSHYAGQVWITNSYHEGDSVGGSEYIITSDVTGVDEIGEFTIGDFFAVFHKTPNSSFQFGAKNYRDYPTYDSSDNIQAYADYCGKKLITQNETFGIFRITKSIYISQPIICDPSYSQSNPAYDTVQLLADNTTGFTMLKPRDSLSTTGPHRLPRIKNINFDSVQYRIHDAIRGRGYSTSLEGIRANRMRRFFCGSGVSIEFKDCYVLDSDVGCELLQMSSSGNPPSTQWKFSGQCTFHSNRIGVLFSKDAFADNESSEYDSFITTTRYYQRHPSFYNTVFEKNTEYGLLSTDVQLFGASFYNTWTESNGINGVKTRGTHSRLTVINNRYESDTWDVDENSTSGGKYEVDGATLTTTRVSTWVRRNNALQMQTIQLLFKKTGTTQGSHYTQVNRARNNEDKALIGFATLYDYPASAGDHAGEIRFEINPYPNDGTVIRPKFAFADVHVVSDKNTRAWVREQHYEDRYSSTNVTNNCKWTNMFFAVVDKDGNHALPDWIFITLTYDPAQEEKENGLQGSHAPFVTNEKLNDATSNINTVNKYALKRVWNTSRLIYVYAAGSNPSDVWTDSSTGGGNTINTPS